MLIDDLIAAVPPPTAPRHARGDWRAVESRLGLDLPADYQAIITRYGAGSFSDLLIVLNPFLPSAYLNLIRGSEEILHSARTVRDSAPSLYPMPLFPEAGGIFPWAVTETGDTLFWETGGESADWTTLVRRSGGAGITAYPLSASGFLLQWLGRRTLEGALSGDGYVTVAEFTPFRKTGLIAAYLAPAPEPFETRLGRLMKHLEARRIKNRYAGLQGFNQCSFRAGPHDVLVVYSDDADFGSRLELHVPRKGQAWTEALLPQVPTLLGSPFRQLGGAAGGFAYEGSFEDDDDSEPAGGP